MRFLLTVLLFIGLVFCCSAHEYIFRSTFDNRNPVKHTVAGFGWTQRADRALVMAKENAADFHAEAAPSVKIPTGNYVPRLKKFPVNGYFDFYARPYFNGKTDSYAIGGLLFKNKEVVKVVYENKKIKFTVNDKSVYVDAADWHAHHYKHIQLVWKDGRTDIYVDRQKRAALDTAPVNADKIIFYESFQVLIDDIAVGCCMPLVLDPEFDGDPKKFPYITPSNDILLSGQWRSAPRLKIENGKDGVNFSWRRKENSAFGVSSISNVTWDVVENEYIKGDFSWTKKSWQYGSIIKFYLQFLNADGKVISQAPIDAKLVNSPKNMVSYMPMLVSEFGTEAGINEKISYFNYYQVPLKAVKVRLKIDFAGNPFTFVLNNAVFRKVAPAKLPWFREPYGKQKIHKISKLTEKEVDAVLAKREKVKPELRRIGDRVELFINGKKTPVHILAQPLAGDYKWIDGFKKAGFNFFLTTATLGRRPENVESEQIWQEDGTVDISSIEKAVKRIIKFAPDAYVFICLSINPTKSWLLANKDQIMTNAKGEYAVINNFGVRGLYSKEFPTHPIQSWYPSTSSVKYQQDIAAIIKKALTEFEKTDAAKVVAGIYVTGGDDGQFRFPPFPDYSKVAIDSYRSFLKSQGRKNWASAEMPDPVVINKTMTPKFGDSIVSDYWRWSTNESYKLRQSMYNAVKNAMPRVLVGGYENAMALTGQPGFGRYKITELLNEKAPDFMISLPGYNRYRDDCDHPSGMKAYNGSMVLHKKLMIGEMDIRNPESGPLGINNRSRNYQATHNKDTFRNFLALYGSYCYSWGGGLHAYIMQPLWYNTDEAVNSWARVVDITRNAEGRELDDNRIAAFCDENSSYYNATGDVSAFFTRLHYRESTEYALWRSGVRCDYYVPSDVFHPEFKAPKILLFQDASTMSVDDAAKIRKLYGNSNRIIIWGGRAGYLPEGKVETVRKITGFNVGKIEKLNKPLVDIRNGKLLWEPAFYAGGFPENAWIVKDSKAVALAKYLGTNHVGMAMKKYPSHTEVYLGQPGSLSPDIIREFARKVGIQTVQEQNDLCIMGGGLLEIGAMVKAGPRKIFFPNGVKNLKCLTGQKILEKGKNYIVVDMPYKDAAIFKMEY
ncbi:MAG: hypothetical protein IKA22_05020 [Lentisphaeria bacterium]|nr:hypothetical protein [Lentisphaeria bacterium]